jgi:NADPH:quinone reductase-like Zn-dependent oxidoreductase
MALTDYKAWAELVAVPATCVYVLPGNMSFEDGASMLMNYVTAYILLFDLANIRKGQSLLVHSAAGGVVSEMVFFDYRTWSVCFWLCARSG